MNNLVIVLGGNSFKNLEWATNLTESFEEHSPSHLHKYHHWSNGTREIDFTVELKNLTEFIREHDGDYYIVAKSAGALLALKGIVENVLSPISLVCIGLPITYAKQRGVPIQDLLKKIHTPILFIQAENDPLGNSKAVNELTAKKGKLVSIPGDSHDYFDIKYIVKLSSAFLEKT